MSGDPDRKETAVTDYFLYMAASAPAGWSLAALLLVPACFIPMIFQRKKHDDDDDNREDLLSAHDDDDDDDDPTPSPLWKDCTGILVWGRPHNTTFQNLYVKYRVRKTYKRKTKAWMITRYSLAID